MTSSLTVKQADYSHSGTYVCKFGKTSEQIHVNVVNERDYEKVKSSGENNINNFFFDFSNSFMNFMNFKETRSNSVEEGQIYSLMSSTSSAMSFEISKTILITFFVLNLHLLMNKKIPFLF
jgi:hypothetical protein